MPAIHLIEKNVDIECYPENRTPISHQSILIKGDLHANALNLLFFLVKEGIASLDTKKYRRFVCLYKKDKLSKTELEEIHSLIQALKIKAKPRIIFLGDELGDRGQNDLSILWLIEKLHNADIAFTLCQSDHGIEFTQAYEQLTKNEGNFKPFFMAAMQFTRSLQKLNALCKKYPNYKEQAKKIIEDCYKAHSVLIDYVLTKQGFMLFSHAPIDLAVIKAMAIKWSLDYNDQTPQQLANTIDAINKKYKTHLKANTVHGLYDEQTMFDGYGGKTINKNAHPFEFILWNRDYHVLSRPTHHPVYHYPLFYSYGHDNEDDNTDSHIFNLDTKLGKRLSDEEGGFNHQETYKVTTATSHTNKRKSFFHAASSLFFKCTVSTKEATEHSTQTVKSI